MKKTSILVAFLLPLLSFAQVRTEVGRPDFKDWSGVSSIKGQVATLNCGEPISYRYPDGEFKYIGFREYYEYASDWSRYAGLQFEVYLAKESTVELEVSFLLTETDANRLNGLSTALIPITGKGWKTIFIPWELFDISEGQQVGSLQAVKELRITANAAKLKKLKIRNLHLTKGERIFMQSPIQGKSADAGGAVQYEVEIGNTTDENQSIQLMQSTLGWESMPVTITPSVLKLAPGEIKSCQIKVQIPARLPLGVRENHVLKAIPNGHGSAAETLTFTKTVAVAVPNIVITKDQ